MPVPAHAAATSSTFAADAAVGTGSIAVPEVDPFVVPEPEPDDGDD